MTSWSRSRRPGGTLLDTAAGYGDGASEELIGTLLGDVVARDDVVLATKAGISRRRGQRETNVSRGSLITTLDPSLERLQVDHVDLWQVHVWIDDTPVEETLAALDYAVTTGRASYVGISNYSGWQTAQAATWQRAVPGRAPLASTQVEYSLLNRHVEHEVLRPAEALGLGVLPWSPLGRGVLTGKYRSGTPADSRAASALRELRRHLPQRALAGGRGRRPRRRGPGLEPARGRPGLGARPTRGHRTDRRRPHRRPARGALGVEELTLPPRSSRRSTTCPGTDTCRAATDALPAPAWSGSSTSCVLPREFSRNVVTRMLVERAEHGGWELDRVRIGHDGTRRVVLRRKIIRQRLTLFAG